MCGTASEAAKNPHNFDRGAGAFATMKSRARAFTWILLGGIVSLTLFSLWFRDASEVFDGPVPVELLPVLGSPATASPHPEITGNGRAATSSAAPAIPPRTRAEQLLMALQALKENVGSEGFAPHIQAALQADDAAKALQAARQLDQCEHIGRDIESGRRFIAETPGLSAGQSKSVVDTITDLEGVQRRCQTVTPDIAALREPLLLKAMQGGEIGAASNFVRQATKDHFLAPGRKELVLAALQADAKRGELNSMLLLAWPQMPYEVPPSVQHASGLAWLQINERRLKNTPSQSASAKMYSAVAEGLKQLEASRELGVQERALAAEMITAYERQQNPR